MIHVPLNISLNGDEQFVLDLVADYELGHPQPTPLRHVILARKPEHADALKATARSLAAKGCLEWSGYPQHERLHLTPTGLLLSKCCGDATAFAEALLSYFNQRLASEGVDFTHYTWNDLKAAGVVTVDEEFRIAVATMGVLELRSSSAGDDPATARWGVPDDLVDMRALADIRDLHLRASRRAAEREAASAKQEERGHGRQAMARWTAPHQGRGNPEEATSMHSEKGSKAMGIKIFVSHAAKDADLAVAFVHWMEGCLVVPAHTIRCTSAPGYKLSVGDPGADALRKDLNSCSVVLGLLTTASLDSAYVLMELGAGWAMSKRVACLLMPGLSFDKIKGPIAGNHATHLDQRPDLMSLVETLSKDTGLEEKSGAQKAAATETFIEQLKGFSGVTPPAPFRTGSDLK